MNAGALGEQFAACLLAAKGYEILARNFKTPFGEIDIIAKKGNTAAMVEVRTRKLDKALRPINTIDGVKLARLITSAAIYIESTACRLIPRLDVIEVVYSPDNGGFAVKKYEHLKGAFCYEQSARLDRSPL